MIGKISLSLTRDEVTDYVVSSTVLMVSFGVSGDLVGFGSSIEFLWAYADL